MTQNHGAYLQAQPDSPNMLKVEMGHISDNNLGRNHDNDNLLAGGTVVSPTPYTPNLNSALLRSSNSQTFAENYPSLSSTTTSSTPTEKCVVSSYPKKSCAVFKV